MRTALFTAIVLARSVVAFADVEPPGKWPAETIKPLSITLRHPAASKVAVHGQTIQITGADIIAVTITISTTSERSTNKAGGSHGEAVDWTIDVPKRRALCHAETDDPDKALVASNICDSIQLQPGARDPHVELIVTSHDIVDAPGYEKLVRAKQHALDACWSAALKKDADLPEGSITVSRDFTDGQAAATNESHENFFTHDTKTLAACVANLLKAVPVKTSGASAGIKLVAICHLY